MQQLPLTGRCFCVIQKSMVILCNVDVFNNINNTSFIHWQTIDARLHWWLRQVCRFAGRLTLMFVQSNKPLFSPIGYYCYDAQNISFWNRIEILLSHYITYNSDHVAPCACQWIKSFDEHRLRDIAYDKNVMHFSGIHKMFYKHIILRLRGMGRLLRPKTFIGLWYLIHVMTSMAVLAKWHGWLITCHGFVWIYLSTRRWFD